ncbi:MAG: adenylyl-sulfate reductase [Chromatiales bacterium]
MQWYVVLMILLVAGGTILDMVHKKNAKYFFENARKARQSAKRTVSGGEKASLAAQTLAKEVLTSGEFANQRRRFSHLFIMYGFVLFVVTTAILIFGYPTPADQAPAIVPVLWHLGALMLAFGGYWFWFFIRVDVAAEGLPWYQFKRADIFILSLLGMATFGIIWSALQAGGAGAWETLFFVLFIAATTILFSSVYWSKFAHMFFKPAAAFQKRVIKADGSRENLPEIPDDLSAAEVKERYPDIPEYMGDKPGYMGLGINREAPYHY